MRTRLLNTNIGMILIAFFSGLVSPTPSYASAGVSALLSIVPGLGQVVNGNPLEGLGWFTAVVGMTFFGGYIPLYAPISGINAPFLPQSGYDLWLYNVYDAYRDAKPKDGLYTDSSVFQNYIGGLNPLNIIDPIGGPTLVGYTYGLGAFNGNAKHMIEPMRPLLYTFVGMGEEGMFRGFIFPSFSTMFKSKWLGAFTSSTLFVVFHITNGVDDMIAGAIPRFLLGMVFCWQTNVNNFDLRKSIFAHTWIDVIVEPDVTNTSSSPFLGQSTRAGLKWSIPL